MSKHNVTTGQFNFYKETFRKFSLKVVAEVPDRRFIKLFLSSFSIWELDPCDMEIPQSFSLFVLLFCLAQSYAISSDQESNASQSIFVRWEERRSYPESYLNPFCSCSDNGTTFQCVKDEKCIPLASKCDGIFDCDDNTDELQCYRK